MLAICTKRGDSCCSMQSHYKYALYQTSRIVKTFFFCSLVKKLAEKGCWDIAEARAKKEKKLVEYLVTCIHIITISVLLYFTKMADSYGQGVECICPCILFCWMK